LRKGGSNVRGIFGAGLWNTRQLFQSKVLRVTLAGAVIILRSSDGKWFLTRVKRTIYNYKMIAEGDRVAVGISGGKDSAALLYIMKLFQKHSPIKFELITIYVDLGWPSDPAALKDLTNSLGLELHVEKTVIAKVVFKRRQEKNPCALCANLRRGALHQAAKSLSCSRVALGHHLDDAIQTMMLNLIYTGHFDTFKPVTYLDRSDLYLIRPLIQLPESVLAALARRENLPLFKNPCPVSGKTKRSEMAALVDQLAGRYPDLREKCRSALIDSPFWPNDYRF
jgi:tRNA 2-thiocytidine biosynthesis protein TtcA